MATLSLTDRTILVTRSVGQSSEFTQSLIHAGAKVIEMPTLEIVAPSSWESLDNAIMNLAKFNWLILTSSNAVNFFFDRLNSHGQDVSELGEVKIAVVGEKTAQTLKKKDLQPDFTPPNFVADSIVEKFPEEFSGKKILFPRVESGGRDFLVREFTAKGAEVVEAAAYQSVCPSNIPPEAKLALKKFNVDVITFASSKTVRFFCQLLAKTFNVQWSGDSKTEEENLRRVVKKYLQGVCVASIGPQTSKSCFSLIGRVDLEAKEYTLDGLIKALVEWNCSLNK